MNNLSSLIKINISELFVLLKRLAVVLVILSTLRILFYLFNAEHFADMTFSHFLRIMKGGVKFDLSAIMFVNALYILLFLFPIPFKYNSKYQSFLKYLFLITNSLIIVLNMGDIFYFEYTLKRTTADVFMFAHESNILKLFSVFFLDFWYGTLIGIAFIFILIKSYNLIKLRNYRKEIKLIPYIISGVIVFVITGYLSVIGMRGSFVTKTFPITVGDAGKYTNKPIEMALVLNTAFSIIKTVERKPLPEKHYFEKEKLSKIYTPIHNYKTDKEFKKLNVVLIILESFSRAHTGYLNSDVEDGNYKGYTPFLDSLMCKSRVFTRAFANGRKSIEALPAIVASIPTVEQAYVSSAYASNSINTLANFLNERGYNSSFFHGAPDGAMGLEAFMRIAGYNNFYGMTEYGNDDDFNGTWGIWDEEFLQFFADKLNAFEQPFNTAVFTLSSHHPFNIPERYENVFSEGKNEIHKSVLYADYALKKFFEKAEKSKWYNNTLFVLTADHSSRNHLKKYNTSIGNYAIPIIYFCPTDTSLIGIDSTVTQQADIMPTVLNYLHFNGNFIAYGNDVLDEVEDNFSFNYLNNTFQLILGDYVLQFSNDKSNALYNYEKDIYLKNNLLEKEPLVAKELEDKIKAIIQDYNYRMVHNELTLK